MRLFLDANVLFAAAHSPGGRSAVLFEFSGRGWCLLVSSRHALDEAVRNLALKSPDSLARLEKLLGMVELVPEAGPRSVRLAASRGLPESDAPILAAAVAAGVDGLVTGDRRHFGQLFGASVAGVRVRSLAAALAELLDRAGAS